LSIKERLSNFWNPTIEEAKRPTAKIVRNQFTKEMPERVTFQKLMKYHDYTPQIQIAVSSYAELITGTDMQVQSDVTEAQEFMEEWIRQNNFYEKFEGLVSTVLICGNGLLEKLSGNDIQDVEEVDMTTIINKKRDDFGKLQWYEQRQQSGQIVPLKNVDDFIEFNLTTYSKQAWGRSLFHSLAVPRTTGFRTTAPLVEIMWGTEDAMGAILLNNAYPITTITYPGANDEYLEKEAERWRRYKPGDKRIQKIKPEIEFFEAKEGSGRYQYLVEHLEKTFELGTQFPHDIMTGDFTSRASSETTETIVMKKVRGYQRYLSNKLKTDLFDLILEQNGFNPEEVNLEVSFTAQNVIELTPDQVNKLYVDNVISLTEVRDWFATNTGMDLTEQELKKIMVQNDLAARAQQVGNKVRDEKVNNLEKTFESHLHERDKQIAILQEKLIEREHSSRYDKIKLTREIMEELKKI